jgi:hypothetical protein
VLIARHLQTQSIQIFLKSLCVGQGLHLDEVSKFHEVVSILLSPLQGTLWFLVLAKTIITIWLQVTSAGLPDAQSASQSILDWGKQKRQV